MSIVEKAADTDAVIAKRLHQGVFIKVSDIEDWGRYRIFDVRYDLKNTEGGKIAHFKGHIPDATFVNLDEALCGTISSTTGRHPLPDAQVFIEWCRKNGITENRPVLCYDGMSGGMGAGRLWWMLDSLGVEVYILNGGYDAYAHAQLPIESTDSSIHSSTSFWPFRSSFEHHCVLSEIPWNALLVDARDPVRFNSTVRPYSMDLVPGHICGARNLPFSEHLKSENGYQVLGDEETIRSNILAALHGAWSTPGAPDLSSCIFYCGSGVTGAFNIAVVHHLGLGKPWLYCGSWSEYSRCYQFAIIRQVLWEYGFFCEMKGPNLTENAKANPDLMTVIVDGVALGNPGAEVLHPLEYLHQGEECIVHYRDGRKVHIKILLDSA